MKLSDKIKEGIAIVLYSICIRPKCTLFIDEYTYMYGYGECHSIGVFEYPLPNKYIEREEEEKELATTSKKVFIVSGYFGLIILNTILNAMVGMWVTFLLLPLWVTIYCVYITLVKNRYSFKKRIK